MEYSFRCCANKIDEKTLSQYPITNMPVLRKTITKQLMMFVLLHKVNEHMKIPT